jgi:MscS family membrane protein
MWVLFSLLNNAVFHYSKSFLKKYPNIRGEMVNFMVNLLKFIITAAALVMLLHSMGFNVTGLLASLGIGGLAVALAAKDTLSNIFGSISIIMDNMFSQGDWIVTDRGEGTIVDIGMRTTKIRTFDNAMIFLPNSYLANTDIKNWNKRKVGRRIKMHIGVTYSSRMEDVLNAIEDIREMLVNHKDIANPKSNFDYSDAVFDRIVVKEDQLGIKNTLLVYLDQYSGSSIDILIYCFSKTVNWAEWLDVKQDVMVKISQILKANNLEFAFPSQSVYLKNEGGEPFEVVSR